MARLQSCHKCFVSEKVSCLSFRAQATSVSLRVPIPRRKESCFSFSLMKFAAASLCSGAACLPKAGLLRSSLKVRFGNSDLGLTFSELGIFRP